MKRALFLMIVFLLGISAVSQAQQVKVFSDKKQSFLRYAMNHPLHSWTGESKDFTSVILTDEKKSEITQVAVSCKISTFDSGNANRDSHMIEVTEAIKYPVITFASTSITRKADGKLEVAGKLTFHGVTKEISFEAEQKHLGNSLEVKGAFTVQMTAFKIEKPSLMGISTDDDIKIDFNVVF